jgi:hypothetical protein
MKTFFAACLLIPLCAGTALSASKTETVKFKAGATSATLKGSVTGYDTHSYELGASAGQVISILFSPNSNACYFNFVEPGADSAIHMGEVNGNEYSSKLNKNGKYRAEAYLMRSEARRGKTCSYTITFEITGSGDMATQLPETPNEDTKVEGTDFNATGEIPCARNAGQPMGSCKFGVKREGNGRAMVTVFWPDAGSRVIFFEGGKPANYDKSEADGDAAMKVEQNADLFVIRIGDQRFEIPDAVINGG